VSIHIGNIIQEEVRCKRLTQKEFGALIHKHEKTVPDIYARANMSIDLLVTISEALQKDFLGLFYREEPLKSLRDNEIAKLNLHIQKLSEEINRLQRELALTHNLVESLKDTISFAKEQIEEYKLKLAGASHC
jgi:chromosome segregation ATPase